MLLNKSGNQDGIFRVWAEIFTPASHPRISWTIVGFCVGLFLAQPAHAVLDASQVAILINKDEGVSFRVARMYQKLRAVPDGNLLQLSLGTNRQISGEQYWKIAADPIKKYLEAHPDVRCILTTSGDPYTVRLTAADDSIVAFDSELAAVLHFDSMNQGTRLPNPLYLATNNPYGVTNVRLLKMIYVSRLDGPDLKTITRMVEDAIATEQAGFQGPVYGDGQGFETVSSSGLGDASIRQAIDRFSAAGFDSKLDLKPETWMQPKNGIGDQAAGAAFYIGWYRLRDFQNIFGPRGLARGSIAWHIASGEAVDIWSPNESGWCVNLLRRGAAVTLGPVREPYLQAFPHGDIFLERLLSGDSVAESYWLALPNVSWAMVLLGDPMYRPFALHPRPALVARAYIADNPSRILKKGETSSLLVQLECVGPEGSSVPTLTAVAEPESGLAAASGTVTIPALKAGQMAVVRVPSVTAATENGGMFRLRLNVLNTEERSRHITLEGRIGLSRLSWGLLPKSQMFVSPNGKVLISGVPGFDGLTSIDTLQTRMIYPPKGTAVAAVAFSPDSAHVALGLLNPEQKTQAVAITDSELNNPQVLPPTRRFLRWLGDDRILVEEQGHYLSHSITDNAEHSFDVPAGWSATAVSITGLEILHKPDGTFAISKGNGETREILQGTKVKNVAVAEDGSVFGGVDDQKRLWVQLGVGAIPKVVAEGVRHVLWGPVSHMALVQPETGDSRVYDLLLESWREVGVISAAQWNSNESRLLFVQAGGPGQQGTLSLFADGQVEPLFSLDRIGPVHAMAFGGQDRAFLLAEPTGEISVWMMNLPPLANRAK